MEWHNIQKFMVIRSDAYLLGFYNCYFIPLFLEFDFQVVLCERVHSSLLR